VLNGVSPLVFSLSRLGFPPEFYALYSQRVVSLLTQRSTISALAAYLSEQSGASGVLISRPPKCSPASPLSSQSTKRNSTAFSMSTSCGLVVKLRDKLVEEFAGADGRLCFVTTQAFLQRFGLVSLQELTAASLSLSHLPQKP
jgi:hypothetical protein